MLGNLGLLVGLGLLIILALRGVNIFIASLLCAVLVAVTNSISVTDALLKYYPFGPLGAFSFAGKFFVLFLCGAIFGKVMWESHAALSIAAALSRGMGAQRALWIVMLACAALTYGGVVVFIVIFTVYPLGLALIREANIPKRLFAGAVALGAGIGLLAGALMLILGMAYLEHARKKAATVGEGFEPSLKDDLAVQPDPRQLPHWFAASIPLAVVLLTILVPRVVYLLVDAPADAEQGFLMSTVVYAQEQPLIWPSAALVLGTLVTIGMFRPLWAHPMATLSRGAEDAIMPLLNTAAVIGFGGVVIQTAGFTQFANGIIEADLPPLVSLFLSLSVVSGIVGSASGGLQIFMQTLAPRYLEMGIDPEVLHRVAALASGGLDSLPHCGAVIGMLTIMGLSHRQAYKEIGVVTVVVPVIATLIVIAGLIALG